MEDTHNIQSGSGEEHRPQDAVQPLGGTAQPGKLLILRKLNSH